MQLTIQPGEYAALRKLADDVSGDASLIQKLLASLLHEVLMRAARAEEYADK